MLQVAILESCRDRNIVQFLGSCTEAGQTLLVTESAAPLCICPTPSIVAACIGPHTFSGGGGKPVSKDSCSFTAHELLAYSDRAIATPPSSILSYCRFMEAGDLHGALRDDREGQLLWYQRCVFQGHHWRPPIALRLPYSNPKGLHREGAESAYQPPWRRPLWTFASAQMVHCMMRIAASDVFTVRILSSVRCCRLPPLGGRSQPGLGKRIALDIARGLAFLHTHRIVHLVQFYRAPGSTLTWR